MYGKFFASAFTGSMCGAGSTVFAVWGYVIAHAVRARVELNPILVAAAIGTTPAEVTAAIEYLCAPDPDSRSPANDGARMVREGAHGYLVVNLEAYRSIRNEDDRRAYNREKQRESRARKRAREDVKPDVSRRQPPSAQAEAEAEAEDPPFVPPLRVNKRRLRRAPADWEPRPEDRNVARGIDLATELAKFRDHEFATPRSDWHACWRNWLRTAAERNRSPPGKPPGALDHEARRIEANTRHSHRAWLLDQAREGAFGPRAREKAEAGTLDLGKMEAWYERQKQGKRARAAGASGPGGPAPISGLLEAAVGGRAAR